VLQYFKELFWPVSPIQNKRIQQKRDAFPEYIVWINISDSKNIVKMHKTEVVDIRTWIW
jgi:hypothetical protein